MVTYEELVDRAVRLKRILEALKNTHSDFSEAAELLLPSIERVLRHGDNLPMRIPNPSFFYRLDQENDTLHSHAELMNAIAEFDAGLEGLDRT